MSQTVRDVRALALALRRANRAAPRLGQGTGQAAAGVRDLSDRIAREALLGLQSRGLVE